MTEAAESVPRVNICPDCDREITAELVHFKGQHALIHEASDVDEGFMPVTAGEATVRLSCRCEHVDVEFAPGSTSAWDVPDAWMEVHD